MHSSGYHPHLHPLPDDTVANQCLFLQVPVQRLYFHNGELLLERRLHAAAIVPLHTGICHLPLHIPGIYHQRQ